MAEHKPSDAPMVFEEGSVQTLEVYIQGDGVKLRRWNVLGYDAHFYVSRKQWDRISDALAKDKDSTDDTTS